MEQAFKLKGYVEWASLPDHFASTQPNSRKPTVAVGRRDVEKLERRKPPRTDRERGKVSNVARGKTKLLFFPA